MGDNVESARPPSGIFPNGLLPDEAATIIQVLDLERWAKAEERTAELIARIQPNKPSEDHRIAIANYVKRLIVKSFPCEVFPYGSVPLKTYLADGDIDLTTFSKNPNPKDKCANKVHEILKTEEQNESAEFRIKEIRYIEAEVKIIKCLVENIVVDISFNQLSGLCTLCFLEEIDHLINQNHLFKRSIILIKAWCYYESRTLGAQHGLISTYALETLVLYIFHVFNNSFAGPLEVLYRFLELFGKFDWENFCVSLQGPVPTNSLPNVTVDPPRNDGGELLLSKLFLDSCSSVYPVLPSSQENQNFTPKKFNVIDPLRVNNNLGRSVNQGNLYRIQSAFAYGAKKLARLLDCPKENLFDEVNQFFKNTWERHNTEHRPDAPRTDSCPELSENYAECPQAKENRATGSGKGKIEKSEVPSTSSVSRGEHKLDILNNDFSIHWKNMQYARFCQISGKPAPLSYPSPVAVDPVYLQGQFPWDGPGRPSENMNVFNQLLIYRPQTVRVAPLQPVSSRPTNADEMPRYHSGTGTDPRGM